MSRLFGTMRQIGYVVPDLAAAMDWWVSSAQIGPWFYLEPAILPPVIHGSAVRTGLTLSAAFANSGKMQIELIQQHCDTPSVYQAFGQAVGGDLHHWSSWPAPEDYDLIFSRALRAGYIAEMQLGAEHGAFVYFSKDGCQEIYFEMAAMVPWRARFFDKVREAAVDWDGRDPIRDRRGRPI